MPAIMIGVSLLVLLPLAKTALDGGATWNDIISKPSMACENTGILNFFFYQNFIHPSESVCFFLLKNFNF